MKKNENQFEEVTPDLVKTDIGRINKCECCETYYVHIGFMTMKMNPKELHSLFYMLLKALKLENHVNGDRH